VRRLRALPAVSVAVVRGLCLGGGLELAASCDLVLAAEGATFGQPEIDLACFPPLAAALYPRALGPWRAADLVLTGRRLSAAEAEAWGLVTRRVPEAGLDAAAEELAAALLAKSAPALAAARRALAAGLELPLPRALAESERIYTDEIGPSADLAEGVAAFLAKRPPRWRHR
jgi:cyclohexa-1,5-dienecarbonyl-CoA hydratase